MGSIYLARRLGNAAITILLIVLINFLLFRAMPGSPERIILRGTPNVTQERLEAARERWGLNDPIFPDQFVGFLTATASGDLGFSFVARGQTVSEVLAQRIWPTIILFGLGELIAIVVGLALGAYSGWKRGGPIDYVGNGASLILYSDAVLPARHDPAADLRDGPRLVPDVRHGDGGRNLSPARGIASSTSSRTWRSRSPRSRSG